MCKRLFLVDGDNHVYKGLSGLELVKSHDVLLEDHRDSEYDEWCL